MYEINIYTQRGNKIYNLICCFVALFCFNSLVYAADKQNIELAAQTRNLDLEELLRMDLRQLTNIDVSLASRIEEKQFKAPAAIYVLTQEDIRRSGHRRLPEILRMVPGLHVGKLDANKWAISSRNSQLRFTSTMLVMIDGRHVFTPFYAGVYWESQDTFIEDIERIEIVRGPGGSLWGANAVDGIINIITKSAANTHGSKAYALAGAGEMKYEAGARYGNKTASEINYRVFAKGYKTDTGEYLGTDASNNNGYAPIGTDANDEGKAQQAGFRMDWNSGKDSYMLQGNAYQGEFDEDRVVSSTRVPNTIESEGYNAVFNWKRELTNGESLIVNAFVDQISRDDNILMNDEVTLDVDLQHTILISNHNVAWGLGYRYYENKARITDPTSCGFATPCFAVDPEEKDLSTWSAFIQDRIVLSDEYAITIGSKFEDNDYTGFEYQPTLRGLWTPDNDTTYWAAATRAVRVPDRVNTDGILDFGGTTVSIGNINQESFINYTYELGYRKRISNTWILDGTVFYSDYRNTAQTTSGIDDVYGFEGYVKYQYNHDLRMELGYTFNEGDTIFANGSTEPRSRLPKHTIFLRSNYDLRSDMDLDAMVYYVDDSKSPSGTTDIHAYTRVDLRYGWRPMKNLDLSLLLTNMLDDAHAESRDSTKINTGVKRGAMLKLTFTN